MANERRFELTEPAEDFLLGRLDGERHSGAYLPQEYLSRLGVVHRAALTRLADLKDSEVPDAVKNLVGIIARLLSAHGTQLRLEFYQPTDEERREAREIEEELQRLQRELERFHGPKDDPPKK
jgi:hypothetical protein